MKLVLGITTYNRLKYLKAIFSSWNDSKNNDHDWTVMIADDGSIDGTLEYCDRLQSKYDNVIVFKNQRRGVHFQKNKMMKESYDMGFDFGFMADDDVLFSRNGWDDLYVRAMQKSGYDHLCFFNLRWTKKYRPKYYKFIFGRYKNPFFIFYCT